MNPLDLRTSGDADSVRSTATGLGTLGTAIDGAGSGFGQASSASESLWTGAAGDAFRGRIGGAQQATGQVVAATKRMATALHTLADRLAVVHATIDKARSIASAAGLTVSADTITPPVPPQQPAAGCYTAAGAAALTQRLATEQARYQRQVQAFTKAERLLAQARSLEQTAHQDAGQAADEEGGILADLNKNKYWLAGGEVTGFAATALDQRTAWQATTQKFGLEYDRLTTAAQAAEDPATRAALSVKAADALEQTAKASDATVGNSRAVFNVDPESMAGKVVRDLPAGLAGAQGLWDVAHAHGVKAKVVAGAADGASYVAGDAATDLAAGALETAAIGGAPETLGLSLVAGGVAYGTGLLVQHYGPGVVDWTGHAASNVAGTVGHAVTHPLDTVNSLAGDIGL